MLVARLLPLPDIEVGHVGEGLIVPLRLPPIQIVHQPEAAVLVVQLVHIAQGVLPLRLGVKDKGGSQGTVGLAHPVGQQDGTALLAGLGHLVQRNDGQGVAVAVLQFHMGGGIGEENAAVPARHLIEHSIQVHALVDPHAAAVLVGPPEKALRPVLQFPDGQRRGGHHPRSLHRQSGAGDCVYIVGQFLILGDAAVGDMFVLRGGKVNGTIVNVGQFLPAARQHYRCQQQHPHQPDPLHTKPSPNEKGPLSLRNSTAVFRCICISTKVPSIYQSPLQNERSRKLNSLYHFIFCLSMLPSPPVFGKSHVHRPILSSTDGYGFIHIPGDLQRQFDRFHRKNKKIRHMTFSFVGM